MKDGQIKEKLESLTPLSGGIVFGKEEAWDRLQARLDARPPRTIPVWWRLSAAAALLAGLFLVVRYYYTFPDSPQLAVQHTAPVPPVPPPSVVPVMQDTVIEEAPAVVRHYTVPVSRETLSVSYPVQVPPSVPDTSSDTVSAVVAVAPPPVPAPVLPHKMRVVHINDLNRQKATMPDEFVYTGPALDISKMKVVSLYDVQREEEARRREMEMMTLVRLSRPHSVLGFSATLSRSAQYNAPLTSNLFSIRLNRNR